MASNRFVAVVTITHSLERPQEELGDVTLSPVFRRVSSRCPVLHLFGYVHIPSTETSSSVAAASDSVDAKYGRQGLNDAVQLATSLERFSSSATPNAPRLPPFVDLHGHTRPTITSPPPKLPMCSVRAIESSAENEEVIHPALTHAYSSVKKPLRSSEVLRPQYTQHCACLHVHGVYPSLLLPQYDASISADQLAAQLETVVTRILGRQGVVLPGQQLVHDVRVVRRYNVYGYRPHAYAFYRVELLDPNMHQKVVDILQNTCEVGGRQWQLYDAHLKYHTEFMVHWRVNGVAPFVLPVQRCHVRLPTAAALRHHHPCPPSNRNKTGEDNIKAFMPDIQNCKERLHHDLGHNGVTPSTQYAGLAFLRFWRPDELGRLTTAEVEMDVCAHDLCESSEDEPKSFSSEGKGRAAVSRSSVSVGDNLSYTRRIIRQYFKEHGVADALRVADTIAMERHLQAKVSSSSTLSTDDQTGSPMALAVLLRYGNVTQIQRADPAVRWMRHRMLEYLEQRRLSAAAVAGFVEATYTTPKMRKVGGGDDPDRKTVKGESIQPPPSSSSGAVVHLPTMPLCDFTSAVTAEQQREQRAIRALMVAEYSKPGGGHRYDRHHHGDAVQTFSVGRVLVPPLLSTFAEMSSGGGGVSNASRYNTNIINNSIESTSSDARYIGFSCDSLQLSPSQDTLMQTPMKAPTALSGTRLEGPLGWDAPTSQSWLNGISREGVRAAEMTSTQDLMAALVRNSSASLGTAEAGHQTLNPVFQETEKANDKSAEKNRDEEEETVEVGNHASCNASVSHSAQNAKSQLFKSDVSAPRMLKDSAIDTLANTAAVVRATDTVENGGAPSQSSSSWSSWSSWSSNSPLSQREGNAAIIATAAASIEKTKRGAQLLPARPDTQLQDVCAGQDFPTQYLRQFSEPSHQPRAENGSEERHGPVIRFSACAAGNVEAGSSSTPQLTPSNEDKEHRPMRESDGAARKVLRFSSPMGAAETEATACNAEGDCVAFVRMRASHSSTVNAVDNTTVCEVLAVARIASVRADTVDLQWLLTLGETHLADDEAALVKRGAWLRLSRCVSVPQTTANRVNASQAENPVRLGEMLLGDAVDTVPASVLTEEASSPALAYAATHSALTQRLPQESSGSNSGRNPEHISLPTDSAPIGADNAERHEGVVQVWPVHCCANLHSYESSSDVEEQHRHGQFPTLQFLCRYYYVIHARMLTSVTSNFFTSFGRVSNPCRPASQSQFTAETTTQSTRNSMAHIETPRICIHPSIGVKGVPPRFSLSRPARCSSTHRRVTRVLFTQPERLSLLDEGNSALEDDGLSSSYIHRPFLRGADDTSTLCISKRRQGKESAQKAPPLYKRSDDEGDGEDTLLFPSSSTSYESRNSSHRRNDLSSQLSDESVKDGGKRPRLELLGAPANSSEHLPYLQENATAKPCTGMQARTHDLKRYRVSTLLMPTHSFVVGTVRIQRHVLHSDMHHSTAQKNKESPKKARESCGVLGPDVPFSNTSLLDEDALASISEATQRDDLDRTPLKNDEEEVENAVVAQSSPLFSSTAQHTVRDTADVMRDAPSSSSVLSAISVAVSEASSVEAMGVVTASQHAFLQLFQHSSSTNEGKLMRRAVLQTGGSLGTAVDGVHRWFRVAAKSNCDTEKVEEFQLKDVEVSKGTVTPSRSPHRTRAGNDGVRIQVSAVTWPYMASTTPKAIDSAPQRYQLEEEPPKSSENTTDLLSRNTEKEAVVSTASPAIPASPGKKSASHAAGLSLSITQQPQHYLQCVLRVQYVEVLLNRRPGELHVSTSAVLAVALGQASTAAESGIGIRIFSVAPAHRARKEDEGVTAVVDDAVLPLPELHLYGLCSSVQVVTVIDEAALLSRVRDEILTYDPDMLLSWEGYKYGLGYLALRYRAVLHRSLAADLSRMLQHHRNDPKPAQPSSRTEEGFHRKKSINDGGGSGCVSCTSSTVMAGARHIGLHCGEMLSAKPAETNIVKPISKGAVREMGGETREAKPVSPLLPKSNVQLVSSSVSSSPSSTVLNDFEPEVYDEDDANDDEARRVPCASGGPSRREWGCQERRYGAGLSGTNTTTSTAMDDLRDTAVFYAKRFGANVHITGRICTSLGKDLRKNVKMPSYALPMVHAELFGQPLPYFTDAYLADLFNSTEDPGDRQTALRYLAAHVAAPHRIACRLRWFTKLLEFSRMYGILTEEVLTRGSQFRVEATLLRLAHPLKYAMLSPSLLQVHRQPRIECIPLVMQPKADLYRREDPIVVLDFRSLYPSIIIAYNLCYTTCLGLVQPTSHGRLGVLTNFTQRDSLLAKLLPDDGAQRESVVFTPNGAMFVSPSTRVGLLPEMVQAVLDTRFELQASLKHIAEPTDDTEMQQRLQEQQLALKMLANVTYGYTAASFTGRMPCVDLAEAIVSLGRQTLERAVALIHSTAAWQAEVVYGDTDSLFVRLHGRTLQEAFTIGQQMADAVTQSNPLPIRLQFEKVLSPCLLLVKKRYAGYMWTSPAQKEPIFFVRGMEVVRRDQCLATTQIMHRMLHLLFDGCTTATLKHVYYTEIEMIQAGVMNPFQYIFRRAVKLGRYGHTGDGHLPLAARLARKQMEKDVTETPYWGEMLPYVVVRIAHAADNLSQQVLHPAELLYLHDKHSLDASYYITRSINSSLDRIFYLVGISFAQWYRSMPRRRAAHAALLNLPTFMKAQGQQTKAPDGSRPPNCLPLPRSAFHIAPLHLLSMTNDSTAQGARLRLVEQLTARMQQLLRGTTDPLLSHQEGAYRTVMEEVISDDDDKEGCRREENGDEGEGAKMQKYACFPQSSPAEVEDLTRPTVHEFVDVEQLMATQHARLPSAGRDGKQNPSLSTVRFSFQRHRGSGTTAGRVGVTLDTFYPRTLCVVCEEEAVSLDDVRRQSEVLQCVDNTLQCSLGDAETGKECVGEPVVPQGGMVHKTEETGRTNTRELNAHALSRPPLCLLLPPICTRCWSDPFSLFLHVQERCRTLGRQLSTLQHICASCIGSGGDWGPTAQALYQTACLDMEDMDSFSCVQVGREKSAASSTTAAPVWSVSRHLLSAVQLSPQGVPQGCVSIDCAVSFEKKWVTEKWQQWQAVQQFLRSVM